MATFPTFFYIYGSSSQDSATLSTVRGGFRMKLEKFIVKPDITLHSGIRVDASTKLKYQNENVKQKLKDLVLETTFIEKADNYTSKTNLKINLKAGEVLIFDNVRGYILPGIPVCTLEEAIEEFKETDKAVKE